MTCSPPQSRFPRPHGLSFGRHAMIACFVAAASLASLQAVAADKPGAKDHPAVGRFAGAEIVDYRANDFDEAVLPVKPIDVEPVPETSLLKVEGKVTRIAYRIPPGKTPLEVMRNYQQALGAGFKTLLACSGTACGRDMASYIGNGGKVIPGGWSASFETDRNRYVLAERTGGAGPTLYLLLYAMQEGDRPATLYQETVELTPMAGAQVKVLDAATLKRGLDTDGKVAVYGVLFDTAKADIKPESKPSLDEMGKLLDTDRALKVYIVGHTDNAGTLAANLDLSQRRADAVAKALATTYRIDAKRLVPRGVASLAPVASNGDEAGRARNRRVELVVQ